MSQVFDFKPGDVIEWGDEQFVVIHNYGTTGSAHHIDDPDDVIQAFYWTAYGETAKLIKRAVAA